MPYQVASSVELNGQFVASMTISQPVWNYQAMRRWLWDVDVVETLLRYDIRNGDGSVISALMLAAFI